jgi:hypothetical protein
VNCKIEGCTNPVVAKEMCSRHYTRWQRHGDPLMVKSTQERPPCGSPGGYDAHLRRREDPCDPCNEARAQKAAEYRRSPAVKERNRKRSVIDQRALRHLAREYPARFTELVEQYKAEVGT